MVISVGLLSGCTEEKKECALCGGSGVCTNCVGTGNIHTDMDGEDTIEVCPSCQGSGICSNCDGTGYV